MILNNDINELIIDSIEDYIYIYIYIDLFMRILSIQGVRSFFLCTLYLMIIPHYIYNS